MTEHEISVGCTKFGEKKVRVEDGEVVVDYETEHEDIVGTAFRACGDSFREISEAEQHIKDEYENDNDE